MGRPNSDTPLTIPGAPCRCLTMLIKYCSSRAFTDKKCHFKISLFLSRLKGGGGAGGGDNRKWLVDSGGWVLVFI